MTDNTIPLIWTTKGNLPEADLRSEQKWVDHPDFVSLTLEYYLEEELVKSSTHVYSKKPLEMIGETQSF